MSCDNCLCNLHICKAECCKQFKLKIPLTMRIFKGQTLQFECRDEDMLLYHKLHNGFVHKNIVLYKLDNFKRKGENLIIFEICQGLTEDFKCSFHETDQQPKVCEFPNKTGTGGQVYVTPNCIFR